MFDDYISSYGRRLFGLCQKLCSDHEDAEDLYQETWMKAYKSFGKYDGGKEFEAWLTSICVNAYRDLLRRQRWKSLLVHFDTNEEKDLVMATIPAPEATEGSDVRDAVNELPEKYRLVVILYYFNGLDIEKTSGILGIPPGTAKYQLHRARELLRGRLDHAG